MNKQVLYTEKYNLVKITPGVHHVAGFGKIDLEKLSLEEAHLLYEQKFPFLEKKEKEPRAPKGEIEAPKA